MANLIYPAKKKKHDKSYVDYQTINIYIWNISYDVWDSMAYGQEKPDTLQEMTAFRSDLSDYPKWEWLRALKLYNNSLVNIIIAKLGFTQLQ